MPLPHPPGYRPPRQRQIDRRRILLAGVLYGLAATVLALLAHRAARTPGTLLQRVPIVKLVVVVTVAGACGSWGETMRQISLLRRSEEQDLEEKGNTPLPPSGPPG
ncbi:MAG: hypothetical protein VKJ66_03085 [Synechococcus sp.]|nr:hypothetical protein [Synechococcus sp.]